MTYTMTEFFCGAGIGAVGFKQAGIDIPFAFDFNEYAVKTYNLNHGNHARVLNINNVKAEDLPDTDLASGGFPCTPFSIGGKNEGEHDESRGNLGAKYFELIGQKQYKAFITENVEGITTERHKEFFFRLLRHIKEMGYNVTWMVDDCWKWGVPQSRNRVFIVGIREDLKKHYVFPEFVPENERTTQRDAIYDIQNIEEAQARGIKNHEYMIRGFSPRSAQQNRQRGWDEPSYTIVSNERHLPIHPEPTKYDFRNKTIEQIHEDERSGVIRRMSVRECLRLQTVPDSYYFPHDDRYKKNGLLQRQYERCSGIPPLVSYKLAKRLIDVLNGDFKAGHVQQKLF